MKGVVYQCFLASAVGGLLSLDRTAAFQVMLSRPLVASPVIGYILGDAMTGLLIGGVLELLFIGELPIGGYIPPHETMLTVVITAVSLIGQKALGVIDIAVFPNWYLVGFGSADIFFILGFAILIVIPMDIICRKADAAARVFNVRLFNAALAGLDKGFIKAVGTNNLKGLGVFFALNLLTIFVLTFSGVLLVYILLPLLPRVVVMSLPFAVGAACATGLSSAYSALYGSRSLTVFLAATFFAVTLLAMVIR
ncbi:MAG: PTS sugar transporter subunit IIC [Deltaproteobacteria bacterium]